MTADRKRRFPWLTKKPHADDLIFGLLMLSILFVVAFSVTKHPCFYYIAGICVGVMLSQGTHVRWWFNSLDRSPRKPYEAQKEAPTTPKSS